MTTTPTRLRSPRGRTTLARIACTAALLLAALCLTPTAGNAAAIAGNYASAQLTVPSGAAFTNCRGWGGDSDDAGRFYSPCLVDGVPALVEYGVTGRIQQVGKLPADYSFLSANTPGAYNTVDVAVTPDGATAYMSVGPNLDNLGPDPSIHPYTKQPMTGGAVPGAILRLRRQADGSWAHDPSFRAGPFQIGANYWSARRVEVDASGRLYTSANSIVFELSPITGGIVTSFGGGATTNGVGGGWIEGIDNAQGISVTDDGNTIYVVEQQHQIVQRWYRIDPVNWRRDLGFLLGTPNAIGDYCASPAHFQSPYDVAQDVAGDVYVMDTTCNRVQRFTNTGAFVQTVWQDRAQADLSHGFAVSWNGSIVLPTAGAVLTRLDPPARPVIGGGDAPAALPAPVACVDRRAPKLTKIATDRTVTTRRTAITAFATDDCGITHIRIRGHRTGRVAWVRGSTVTVPLKGWNGRKTLTVQVRDSRGRTSTKRIRVKLALPQAELVARARVRLAGRRCTPRPLSRVGGASKYRLSDSCATLRGRVTRVDRSGSSRRVTIRLSATTARRIFTNAVGPVDLWVISDRGTRFTGRSLRRGRTVTAVGAIIAERDRSAAFMIPVTRIATR